MLTLLVLVVNIRQVDYLALRGAAGHYTANNLMSFGGRMDANPRNSSLHSSSTYNGKHAPSIPGAAPKRSFEDLLYPQSSPNPDYGVSFPPQRDNGSGKGFHGTSLEYNYHCAHPRIDRCRMRNLAIFENLS